MPLHLPKEIHRELMVWAAAVYPYEGCGLLIGRFQTPRTRIVVEFRKTKNEAVDRKTTDAPTLPADRRGPGKGKEEFVMAPKEVNRADRDAQKAGLDIVGTVHTHPDHPARPSAVDESQPFLARWSNVILSVQKGVTKDVRSWYREMDDEPLVEEEILIDIK